MCLEYKIINVFIPTLSMSSRLHRDLTSEMEIKVHATHVHLILFFSVNHVLTFLPTSHEEVIICARHMRPSLRIVQEHNLII